MGGLTERAGHHVVDLVECALPVEGHPPRRVPEPIKKQLGQGRRRHRILFIKKRRSDACLVGKGATVTPLYSYVNLKLESAIHPKGFTSLRWPPPEPT